jgi:hypothetical protein|tara:strand:+ start:1580 stop:1810 length:231 start_codon:yes stop_codon:yes gene_type:complete
MYKAILSSLIDLFNVYHVEIQKIHTNTSELALFEYLRDAVRAIHDNATAASFGLVSPTVEEIKLKASSLDLLKLVW